MDSASKGEAVYAIQVKGHLSSQWRAWFDGMTLELMTNGDTLIRGAVADQAALHGLLNRVRDLGVPLISCVRMDPEPSEVDISEV